MANRETLLIRIRLSDDDFGSADDDYVFGLESLVDRALPEKLARHLDGHEFGGAWATVFC